MKLKVANSRGKKKDLKEKIHTRRTNLGDTRFKISISESLRYVTPSTLKKLAAV